MGKAMKASWARMSTFARGVAYGLFLAGWATRSIAGKVKKTDQKPPSLCRAEGAQPVCAPRHRPVAGSVASQLPANCHLIARGAPIRGLAIRWFAGGHRIWRLLAISEKRPFFINCHFFF